MLVCFREVRQVFEAYGETNVRNLFGAVFKQLVRLFETALHYPPFGCEGAEFLEVAFESRKAAPRVVGNLLYREVLSEIAVHELEDVYLPRLLEVEQRGIKILVGVQQHIQPFGHFQFEQFVRGRDV